MRTHMYLQGLFYQFIFISKKYFNLEAYHF